MFFPLAVLNYPGRVMLEHAHASEILGGRMAREHDNVGAERVMGAVWAEQRVLVFQILHHLPHDH